MLSLLFEFLMQEERSAVTIDHEKSNRLIGTRYYDPVLIGMAVLTPQGNVLDVNGKLCELLGYAHGEFVANDLFALLHPDDTDEACRRLDTLSKNRAGQLSHKFSFRGKNGAFVPLKTSVQVAPSSAESAEQHLIATFLEFTETSTLRDKLRASEERNRLLLRTNAEAVIVIDNDGRCSFCNPVAARILGYPNEAALLGHKINSLFYVDPDDFAEDADSTHSKKKVPPCIDSGSCPVMNGERCEYVEGLELVRNDGSRFFAEFYCQPLSEDGPEIGAIATFTDISRRKNLQLKSVRAAQLASLGELSAGIAHEINNPIGGVINYAQILRQRYADQQPVVDLADRIFREGERIAAIVKNMLFFAGNREGKRVLSTPAEIVEYTVKLVHLPLERDFITLEIDVPGDLPPLRVNFQEIEQLFLNLISNARYALNQKYLGDHDGKLIRVTAKQVQKDEQRWVRTEIHDNGTGIPAAVLDRIMVPFMTTKPAGVGTGLGLSLGQDIVRRHDGRIKIDSREGEWTCVLIDLPVAEKS